MQRRFLRIVLLLFSIAAAPYAPGQVSRPISIAEYRAKLQSLRSLTAACQASATACDAMKIGQDVSVADAVTGEPEVDFTARWDWLRKLIDDARKPGLEDRDKLLAEAATRLDAELLEADDATAAQDSASKTIPFRQARTTADSILARAEFKHVTRENPWERIGAHIGRWLDRLFSGASKLGRIAPWLGPLLEWGFVAIAIAGLMVWAQRAMQRQRLAIQFDRASSMTTWQQASRDWATLAETAALKGEWRVAVHALYWATVTELEGRHIWRQNSARTPREYLRLIRSESPHYASFRALTQSLERIWYGLAPAAQGDYDHARALYEELRAA